MRYAISSRVPHLIFRRVLPDAFALYGQATLDVVSLRLVSEHEFQACHVGLQVVSGVLKVCAHTKVLARLRLSQPILSLYVIFLLFLCRERRPN